MRVRSQGKLSMAGVGILAALFLFPSAVFAADFNLSPSTDSHGVGEKFTVQVSIDPSGDSVNAADGALTFDKTVLSVDSISKDGSKFSLWTADPSFSNSAGTIEFSGGSPSAFTSKGTVITITFKGIAKGSGSVTFTKGSILAADGKGTDVYKNGNGGTYTITDAAPAADTTDNTDTSSGSDLATPLAPIIASPSHPKPDTYYGTTTAVFTWDMTPDITAVRTLLSDKPDDTPKTSLKVATGTETVIVPKDGVWYYFVQLKNAAGWGDVGSIKLQVDVTPPTSFDVTLEPASADGAPPKLAFKTDDTLSGLDHYEISIGTSTPIAVRAQDITDGTYPVPPQPGGTQTVTVKAYDKAGNVQSVSKDLELPAVAKPKPASATSDQPTTGGAGWGFWQIALLLIFALACGGLFGWNWYTRKLAQKEKSLLLEAVMQIRDKNDRIFSAMREEFEQMINDFDERPQLTPQERDLLEGIKEVLDISEELVDTSIEDLKKMVRSR